MNKSILAVGEGVVLLIMIICLIKVKNRKEAIRTEIFKVFCAGIASVVANMLIYVSDNFTLMRIGFSAFYASVSWLCFAIFCFSFAYTGHEVKNNKIIMFFRILVVVDSFVTILNIFFEHSVTYNLVEYGSGDLMLIAQRHFPFILHLILCYVLMASIIVLLFIATIRSSSIYRAKYIIVGAAFVVIVIMDGIFLFTENPINSSVLAYAVGSLLIYYSTFVYVPKRLRMTMQALVLTEMEEPVVMFDNEGCVVYANDKAARVLDAEKNDRTAFDERFGLFSHVSAEYELETTAGTGTYYVTFSDITDNRGKYAGTFYMFRDITEQKKFHEKEQYLLSHDSLTGIYNRGYFIKKTEELLGKYPQSNFIIVCSDIRRFKVYNEMYGNKMGDKLLIAIAQSLRENDDNMRVYARVGGDSFALCLPKDNFDIDAFFEKSDMCFKETSPWYPISNHIGIYEITDKTIPVSIMLDRAMLAVHSTDVEYRKDVCYYSDALSNKLLEDQKLLRDLKQAFEEEQFEIYLQPQVNHKLKRMVGAEALVRWIHPTKGIILPGDFISVLENNGMITELDQIVWEKTCRMIRRWMEEGRKIVPVSVNISTKSFYYIDVFDTITKLLEKYEIQPSYLRLEITENAFSLDMERHLKTAERLRTAGFILELDDFGSGYSSLNTLKNTPVDILKLDMRSLTTDDFYRRGKDIIEMVAAISKRLNMPIIAEGVEEKAQADMLTGLGCEVIQGFYYSKAIPVEEFEKFEP